MQGHKAQTILELHSNNIVCAIALEVKFKTTVTLQYSKLLSLRKGSSHQTPLLKHNIIETDTAR